MPERNGWQPTSSASAITPTRPPLGSRPGPAAAPRRPPVDAPGASLPPEAEESAMEPGNVHSGSELERRYRRLMLAYPRRYRGQRGEEMLATLLETAATGQRRPSRLDTVDI